MMCFVHAGIPSVTVASTTALMLFCPSVPHVLCLYLNYNSLFGLMFLRNFRSLYRPLSFYALFRMVAVKVSPSICLNNFHSGVLSKGPEELADGDHDHLRGRERGGDPHNREPGIPWSGWGGGA